MKKQSGFTLIELIVVIVILGILAATALPRFVDLKGDANRANLEGIAGSMRSAAMLAHAAQLAAGTAATAPVSMENQAVTMVDGYPTADANGIVKAVNSSVTLTLTGGGAGAGASAVISTESPADPNCGFTYTAASGTAPPSVTNIVATGC